MIWIMPTEAQPPVPLSRPRFDEERAQAMWLMYMAGNSLEAVARRFGVSNQRVSQILARHREGMVRCYWCGALRDPSLQEYAEVAWSRRQEGLSS